MIRLADNSMIADLRQIRKNCFGEDDNYLNLYFSQRFRPEYTLVYLENNRAIASLTMLPCTLVTPRQIFPVSYIYAVATLPTFQRQGISKKLLQHAQELLRLQNITANVLIPATESLFAFYAHQGFSTFFYHREIIKTIAELPLADGHEYSTEVKSEELSAIRNSFLAKSGCYIQWDTDALRYIVNECMFSGGKVLFSNRLAIYAFCYPQENTLLIKETNAADAQLPTLVAQIKNYFPETTNVIFYCPTHSSLLAHQGKVQTFGMWKPLKEIDKNLSTTHHPYIGLVLD